jgi:Rne/Rng family ribonuclease
MAKELFISSTPHETKVAVVEDEQLAEIYFERENEYTLAGSIYKGRVTRVLPGMQSAFVDVGLERDAFLYVTDFLEEQEDQEDFEHVVTRAHSDAHKQTYAAPQAEAEQDASMRPPSPAISREKEAESGPGQSETQQSSEGQFERTPRKWRGRRGRRRGRGEFQEHSAAPSQSTAERIEGNEAGPVLLPGESLSKYRGSERQQASGDSPEQPGLVATGDEGNGGRVKSDSSDKEQPSRDRFREQRPPITPEGEGFAVLPGESLSKYRNRGESQTPSAPATPSPEPRRDFRQERSQREQRPRWEAPPSGPGVDTLPGESLAKYRNRPAATELSGPEASMHRESISEPHAEVPVDRSAESHFGHESKGTFSEVEQSAEPESRVEAAEVAQHDSGSSEIQSTDSDSHHAEPAPHQFGSGVLEEEVIEEEESENHSFLEHPDEEIYEELEEETLDSDNAEQLVEAVREAHQSQRLGFGEPEPGEVEDHASGEEQNGESEANGEAAEAMEAGDSEDSHYQEHEEEEEHNEELSEHVHEHSEEEGRAELRAPANTAAFQQRTERADRPAPDRFRRGGRHGRPMRGRRNIQRESQPTITDLLKEGQEILVQIAKEPIAKKGARITSHIALPGRFLVYMPTVNHVGVSRKIGSDEERQRLKRVLLGEKGNAHGGFIVRTAAAGASEEDLRSDLRFLINLWNDIKSRSETSKAPALIYHDLNLVERILRDQVTATFSGVWVDSEQEYERIVRFLGRFQPAMVKRAKLYSKDTPLFEQFGIQEEVNNALKSKVWLKSGGYIVINQTEALVAIDINTGKYVGKTARLEDTIVKTNIDAIKEIVRQIRLRDLGGIIVIDFIDMDERRNRQKVMQALEEELKNDRAPSKVLQFNDFGLVAITRKRVKQSLERH